MSKSMTILEQAKELRQQASDHMNLEGLDRIKVKKLEHHTVLTLCDALIEAFGALQKIADKDTLDGEKYNSYAQAFDGVADFARDFLTKHGVGDA